MKKPDLTLVGDIAEFLLAKDMSFADFIKWLAGALVKNSISSAIGFFALVGQSDVEFIADKLIHPIYAETFNPVLFWQIIITNMSLLMLADFTTADQEDVDIVISAFITLIIVGILFFISTLS